MSRIGRRPLTVPDAVTLTVNEAISATGPKGTLSLATNPLIEIKHTGATLTVERRGDSKSARSLHGLYRTLIRNMVEGVTQGFEKRLELKGVGYRAAKQGNDLQLNLGFSHPVVVAAPAGIEFVVEKSSIIVRGIDKQLVGETAATIRRLRPPEPYKGKGIRYSDETIRMKAGKAAKAAGK